MAMTGCRVPATNSPLRLMSRSWNPSAVDSTTAWVLEINGPSTRTSAFSSRPIVNGCPRSTRQTPSAVRTSIPQSVTTGSEVVPIAAHQQKLTDAPERSSVTPRCSPYRGPETVDSSNSLPEPVDDLACAREIHEATVHRVVVVGHARDLLEIGERRRELVSLPADDDRPRIPVVDDRAVAEVGE